MTPTQTKILSILAHLGGSGSPKKIAAMDSIESGVDGMSAGDIRDALPGLVKDGKITIQTGTSGLMSMAELTAYGWEDFPESMKPVDMRRPAEPVSILPTMAEQSAAIMSSRHQRPIEPLPSGKKPVGWDYRGIQDLPPVAMPQKIHGGGTVGSSFRGVIGV